MWNVLRVYDQRKSQVLVVWYIDRAGSFTWSRNYGGSHSGLAVDDVRVSYKFV